MTNPLTLTTFKKLALAGLAVLFFLTALPVS